MNEHSEKSPDWETQRNKIIGLGETSLRKSYYPELQQRILELEQKNRELQAAYAEQTAGEEELRQQIDETITKEKELRESEERFRTLIEASPVAIVLARDGIFSYTNSAFCHMTGYDCPADVVGKPLLDFVAPECRQKVAGFIAARQRGKSAELHYEAVGLRRDGSCFPYEITIAVIELAEGKATIAFITDISGRKRIEETLSKSEERLRRAELVAGLGHWEFFLEPRDVYASEGARSLYGLSDKHGKIADVQKIPLPECRTMLDEALRGLIENNQQYDVEFRIKRPSDGKLLDIHSIAEYDPKARIVFGVLQDITNHKRVEKALRESEKKYRNIVETTPDLIWEIDLQGNFTYLSPQIFDMFGYQAEELSSKSIFFLVPPDQIPLVTRAFEQQVLKGPALVTLEVIAQHAEGHLIDIEIRSANVTDEQGRVVGFRGVTRDISERKRAEESLRESEERFVAFMDHHPITAFIKDEQSTNLFVNQHMEEVFGAKEWIGKSVLELFPKDAAEKMIDDDQQTLRDGFRKTIENLVEKNGDLKNFETYKFRIDRENKSPLIGGFAIDITERKRGEDALRESEEMFRSLIRESADGISLMDERGTVIEWNDAMVKISGIPREEAVGAAQNDVLVSMMIPEHRTPDRIERFRQAISQAQQTGESVYFSRPIEARILRRDGSRLIINQVAFPIRTAKGYRIGSIARDITEAKAAQVALQTSEERYRRLVEITDTGYLVLDSRGLVIDANDVYIRLTGRSSLAELVGRSVTEWTAPYDLERNAREVEKCMQTGSVRGLEIDYIKPDGTIQPIEVNATVFNAGEGDMILTLCRDISQRKRTNVALQQARNKLNLLNAVTFQDIQTAAFSLSAYQELAKNVVTDTNAKTYLEKQQMFLKQMVDTLDFAKNYQDMGMHPPRWQNVRQVFLYAISHLDFLHMKQNLQLDNLEIFADPLFEKALFNLMQNVLIHGVNATEVTLRYEGKTDNLMLFIEDNGVGIPLEEKNMIFDRGYGKGTGLGLFLVREVLSITGMTIRETGMSGKGTRFEIIVPKGTYRYTR